MRRALFFISLFAFFCFPAISKAIGETPFGGMFLMSTDCTCSDDTLVYIDDYYSHTVLALLYQPAESILFSGYNIYGTYQLGTYTPGGECMVESGPDCVAIDVDGTYGNLPGTGTSVSFFSPFFKNLIKFLPRLSA